MQLLSAPTGTQAHTLTLSRSHTLAYTFSNTHIHTKRLSRHSLSAAIIKFDFLNLKTCINYNTKQSHTHTYTGTKRTTHTYMHIHISASEQRMATGH